MTGKGGSGGGFRIFPELRKVLGCYMPNFRSLGQSLHIDNFCKNQGVGGGPYYPFLPQSPNQELEYPDRRVGRKNLGGGKIVSAAREARRDFWFTPP